MELKKTIKLDGKLKGICVVDGICATEDGVKVDLYSSLEAAYPDGMFFDLSTTRKTEETFEPDVAEDIEE